MQRKNFRFIDYLTAFVIVILPLALCIYQVHHWHINFMHPLLGDEAYYLAIADSLRYDHDLDLKNNYSERLFSRIDGPLGAAAHTVEKNGAWYSIHSIGVGILAAQHWSPKGYFGPRLDMLAFNCLALIVLFLYLKELRFSLSRSAVLLFPFIFSIPFLIGSSQIYPDFATGTLVTTVMYVIYQLCKEQTLAAWHIFCAAIAIALLPWLHIKNALPAAFFTVVTASLLLQNDAMGRLKKLLLFLIMPVCSALVLLKYHFDIFGKWSGYYYEGSLTTDPSQFTMIFLGLHLDQTQGMFLQNPWLLIGLFAWPKFFQRNKRFAAILLLTYLLIVPNALHHAWYGGFSLSGRFFWSSFALWLFPIYDFVSTLRSRKAQLAYDSLTALSLAWTLWLQNRILHDPSSLRNVELVPEISKRISIFSASERVYLPHFHDFASYWSHLPNLVFIGLLALIAGAGLSRLKRSPWE